MKRVLLLLLALSTASCATFMHQQREWELVNRGIEGMGGVEALGKVRAIAIKGTMKQWEPEQSNVPGGEMRFANQSTFETVADLSRRAVRTDWVKQFAYPAPRTYTFTEIVTPDAGYVIGIDSASRNKQSLETDPPAHSMSGQRLAVAQREWLRASPLLLLDILNDRPNLKGNPTVRASGVTYPAVRYKRGDDTYIVAFDPKTHLPVRIRTLDHDNIWGDVDFDLVLSDWQPMGGIRYPATQQYELNGRLVSEVHVTDVVTNPAIGSGRFEPPAAVKAGAAKPATGNVPYQWVLRRQFIGAYLDSENPSYDTNGSPGLSLTELAPGVLHQVGGTHNTLIVEMSDFLVAMDAPVSDWQSNWTIAAAKERFPNKPIKYLVLTHHHMDHAGGIRAYAAQGATLVVGKGAGAHFAQALAAPSRRNPDLPKRLFFGNTPIVEVQDKYVITDGKREFAAYLADNPHATAYLIGYVADARIAFVSDLWSPGRDPLPAKITPPLAAVVNAVKKAGISPVRFAGGHGSTGDYAPLAALAGK